jgi:dephospho-CoA kinase
MKLNMSRLVVAVVGMPGAGKSEVAQVFVECGFRRVRFGDLTDEEVERRGLSLCEENERQVRESLRRKHGMAAYAKLNLPRIEAALRERDVVVDGLYSWEEYLSLKDHFRQSLWVVAVWSSPETRYRRLGQRAHRPLTAEEAASRDRAEIEQVNKGGPIAMADFTITNESSIAALREQIATVIKELESGKNTSPRH